MRLPNGLRRFDTKAFKLQSLNLLFEDDDLSKHTVAIGATQLLTIIYNKLLGFRRRFFFPPTRTDVLLSSCAILSLSSLSLRNRFPGVLFLSDELPSRRPLLLPANSPPGALSLRSPTPRAPRVLRPTELPREQIFSDELLFHQQIFSTLDLKGFSLQGTLAPEIGKLRHLKALYCLFIYAFITWNYLLMFYAGSSILAGLVFDLLFWLDLFR
ncbi:uncharacterized protein LOC141833210 [Curcuma longa]|uniref:uncharacterized protein LOC141833210 n=1 Tax=Curcuma longa TaxID=136217 RepID=UPI003D9F504A